MHDTDIDQNDSRATLFEAVCHYACNMSEKEIKSIKDDHRVLGLPIMSLVAADWMTVIDYIITGLTKIEYQLEHPLYREDTTLPALLDRLHPLRRLLPSYRTMISETLNAILNTEQEFEPNPTSIYTRRLNSDFKSILVKVEELQTRTPNIMSLLTAIIGMDENDIQKQASETNKNLARVTYIAVIFAPMAFISSFFSMEADLTNLKQTFWIYLVVAIPITLACLFVADGRNIIDKSHIPLPKSWQEFLRPKEPKEMTPLRRRTTMRDPEQGNR
jgi:Mg2+ and Co2+ transporter CorA